MPKVPQNTQRWIELAVGNNAHFTQATILPGATSATVHAVTVQQNSVTHHLVLRQFTNADWLKAEPDLARHEANALTLVAQAQPSTPELIAFDEVAEQTAVPSILMSRVEGSVDLMPSSMADWLQQLAEALVQIHSVADQSFPHQFYLYNTLERATPPVWAQHPHNYQRLIQILQDGAPPFEPTFIHRDYHPTNVLWHNGQLSGIVDWVNACIGPAGIDVAHCRFNLAGLFGVEAADQFLDYYQQVNGSQPYHPYFDLLSIWDCTDDAPPTVYPGWPANGVTHLTDALVQQRTEAYVASVLARF